MSGIEFRVQFRVQGLGFTTYRVYGRLRVALCKSLLLFQNRTTILEKSEFRDPQIEPNLLSSRTPWGILLQICNISSESFQTPLYCRGLIIKYTRVFGQNRIDNSSCPFIRHCSPGRAGMRPVRRVFGPECPFNINVSQQP